MNTIPEVLRDRVTGFMVSGVDGFVQAVQGIPSIQSIGHNPARTHNWAVELVAPDFGVMLRCVANRAQWLERIAFTAAKSGAHYQPKAP